MDEKLTKREKIAAWLILFVVRMLIPKLNEDMAKCYERIVHELYCST
jgi:hypothetical protein